MPSTLRIEITGRVARVTLSRPQAHNAFHPELVAELAGFFKGIGNEPGVQVVLLAAEGKSFSAGADLEWMQRISGLSDGENRNDARSLATMFAALDECPKVVIARVQGAALGGGAGLVACCDSAVAADTAVFGFPEVRLGLIPAVIAPYVVRKIGVNATRELFLSGERISATRAQTLGLVHHVAAAEKLDEELQGRIEAFLAGAPGAQNEAKALVREIGGKIPPEIFETTIESLARRRTSEEGREGLRAYLEKRKPAWDK